MAKFNMDEQEQLADPIEIQLGEKVYTIKKLTDDLIRRSDEAGKEKKLDSVFRQLSILIDAPEEELKKYDIRVAMKALRFITDQVEVGVNTKN